MAQGVASFFAGHRADDGQVLCLLGDPRKVLAHLESGNGGLDGSGGAAVGVARFGAESFELARAPLHPEQDAGFSLAAQLVGLHGHQIAPGERTGGQGRGRQTAEKMAAADDSATIDRQLNFSLEFACPL